MQTNTIFFPFGHTWLFSIADALGFISFIMEETSTERFLTEPDI